MNTLTFNRSRSRGSAWRRISRLVLAASVLFAVQPAGLQPAPARAESPTPPSVAPGGGRVTAASLGRLPRYFVENRGQVAGDTAYTFRASGATVHFTEQGVRYDLVGPSQKEPPGPRAAARSPRERQVTPVSFTEDARPRASVDLAFVGARMSRPQGRDLAPTVYHFQTGPQSTWHRNVPTFERVAYRALWPGVDLVYETTGSGLKYSFELAPGADASLIRLAYNGASSVQLNDAGQLVVSTKAGELRDDRPVVYQDVAGTRVTVPSAYALDRTSSGDPHIGFRLGAYDRALPLIIDPAVLLYSGFVGGNGADVAWATALGPGGVAYVAGQMENVAGVDIDAFVARINAAGTALLSMTIIGGSETDVISAIAVDPDGNSYIAGKTGSPNLPIVNGFDATCGGDSLCEGYTDAFMMKLNPNGAILYSTYLGGSTTGSEEAYGIAIDPQRRAVVVGVTTSDDFPTLNPLFPLKKGFEDGFVTKIDPAQSGAASLVWSTFLGGSGNDALFGVAIDFTGAIYVTGYAGEGSTDYPLHNEVQGNKQGTDVVVTKIKANGSALSYSTYLGGDSLAYEIGFGIAVDKDKNAYVTGTTSSKGFPTTPLALKPQCLAIGLGCIAGQAFVTKLNALGQLVYSTFLGGDAGATSGEAIAVDADGRAYVTGETADPTYPTTLGALDPTCGSDGSCNGIPPNTKRDAFVAVLNPLGSGLAYSSFLGGHAEDKGSGIAVGAPGVIYLAGMTDSNGSLGASAAFPTTAAAWNATLQGNRDGFAAKLLIGADLSVDVKDVVDPVVLLSGVGGIAHYRVDIKNLGPQLATGVQVPITFDGKVEKTVVSAHLAPPGIGACSIIALQWVSCTFGLLNPGDAATVLVNVKVTKLLGGPSQVLTATASIKANEPDSAPLNNQDKEPTLIKK